MFFRPVFSRHLRESYAVSVVYYTDNYQEVIEIFESKGISGISLIDFTYVNYKEMYYQTAIFPGAKFLPQSFKIDINGNQHSDKLLSLPLSSNEDIDEKKYLIQLCGDLKKVLRIRDEFAFTENEESFICTYYLLGFSIEFLANNCLRSIDIVEEFLIGKGLLLSKRGDYWEARKALSEFVTLFSKGSTTTINTSYSEIDNEVRKIIASPSYVNSPLSFDVEDVPKDLLAHFSRNLLRFADQIFDDQFLKKVSSFVPENNYHLLQVAKWYTYSSRLIHKDESFSSLKHELIRELKNDNPFNIDLDWIVTTYGRGLKKEAVTKEWYESLKATRCENNENVLVISDCLNTTKEIVDALSQEGVIKILHLDKELLFSEDLDSDQDMQNIRSCRYQAIKDDCVVKNHDGKVLFDEHDFDYPEAIFLVVGQGTLSNYHGYSRIQELLTFNDDVPSQELFPEPMSFSEQDYLDDDIPFK